MIQFLKRYTHWLHTQWPAGTVEKLPAVNDDGSTNVPGVYVVGDLTGIPLLKFAADSGAKAVQTIANNLKPTKDSTDLKTDEISDIAIIGAGIAGVAAALEAQKQGFSFQLIETTSPFATIENFPKAKPIFTYPTNMTPKGDLQFGNEATTRERLLDDLTVLFKKSQIQPTISNVQSITRTKGLLELQLVDANGAKSTIKARRVIVAIGRSGNYRELGVPGENLDKVSNRLHDANAYQGKNVLVVGGGDSALESAIALSDAGCNVTLSYRKPTFSRPKADNIDNLQQAQDDGSLTLMMASTIKHITPDNVTITDQNNNNLTIDNDAVFTLIGREAPLDFFRRSGVHIRGDWRISTWLSLLFVMLACVFIYHWKTDAGIPIKHWFEDRGWFPFNIADAANPASLFGSFIQASHSPGFYYSLAYCLCVIGFGFKRMAKRKTPYINRQTITLMTIQTIALFLIPYILLPWAGQNGFFEIGENGTFLGGIADHLFEPYDDIGHDRAYWRSFGFILAWPLFFWNVFTEQPMWAWLIISLIQTFVIIPLIVYRWGKGAYCGWICSCGALAETLGDNHRHKMPHGPIWNKLNMVGQVALGAVALLVILRIIGWIIPGNDIFQDMFRVGFEGKRGSGESLGFPINLLTYQWIVDVLIAGILGVGFYWHFSGRVWCRFACPLAALMHIYSRFSQYRIFSDKKKCISCNACTTTCHQGIDIMNFANKGNPMDDPQCVRCSACVQVCPTGVLSMGRLGANNKPILDRTHASPVQMAELTIKGKPHT